MPEVTADAVIEAISNQRNNALNEAAKLHALLENALTEIEELKTKLSTAQEMILDANGLKLVDPPDQDGELSTAKTPAS